MKRLFLALLLVSVTPAFSSAAESETVHSTFKDTVKRFDMVNEATEFYTKALADSKCDSLSAIYKSFGADITQEGNETTNRMDSQVREMASHFGSLVSVDPCLSSRLGNTLQRVGYILLYEHGLAFIDTALVRASGGWRVFDLAIKMNPDAGDTLRAIPTEFFHASGADPVKTAPASSQAPAVEHPDATVSKSAVFSVVEPDKETGGYQQTIYVVNEHDAPMAFEDVTVNPGEAMRFIRKAAKMENLVHSFSLGGPEGDVVVRTFPVKGTQPIGSPK